MKTLEKYSIVMLLILLFAANEIYNKSKLYAQSQKIEVIQSENKLLKRLNTQKDIINEKNIEINKKQQTSIDWVNYKDSLIANH